MALTITKFLWWAWNVLSGLLFFKRFFKKEDPILIIHKQLKELRVRAILTKDPRMVDQYVALLDELNIIQIAIRALIKEVRP